MQTAKKLGYVKGDFIFTGLFPGIIVGEVHTTTPMCEVWGIEQEIGSCYAEEITRLTFDEFVRAAKRRGHQELKANHPAAKEAILKAAEATHQSAVGL